MGNPKRIQRRAKRKKRKKGRGHAGTPMPLPPRSLIPPMMSPEQIEALFKPIREAFADVGREATDMETDPGVSDAGDDQGP